MAIFNRIIRKKILAKKTLNTVSPVFCIAGKTNKRPALHASGANIYYLINAWNSCRLITPGASFMFSDLIPDAVALAAAMVVM